MEMSETTEEDAQVRVALTPKNNCPSRFSSEDTTQPLPKGAFGIVAFAVALF